MIHFVAARHKTCEFEGFSLGFHEKVVFWLFTAINKH